jgi:DtxR family Mn-dependent transcriptional regulator
MDVFINGDLGEKKPMINILPHWIILTQTGSGQPGWQQPLIALGVFFGLCLLALLLFWPYRGVLWKLKRYFQLTQRVLIEDFLKHAFEHEVSRTPASIEEIRKHMEISARNTKKIVAKIEENGLGKPENGELHLTEEGREYAMRIIRAHRLWEHYLSELTGISEHDWHDLAEHKEHNLSEEEANQLAQALGNPLYDPHGDPIPTADGEFIAKDSIDLPDLETQQTAVIAHIEDEPKDVYKTIADKGLASGMKIQVQDKKDGNIQFWGGGSDHTLTTEEAQMISVTPFEPAEPEEDIASLYRTLDKVAPGETATVIRLSPSCRGLERRRLMDFGIVPGTEITNELQAIGKDPIAYRVRGSLVALRRQQASQIFVNPSQEVS